MLVPMKVRLARSVCRCWALLAALSLFGLNPRALADDKHPAFATPESAGPDFLIQGEYVGSIGRPTVARTLGAQVIALGEGKFEGILYFGGLPGDGWDEKTRFYFRGETKGPSVDVMGVYGERLMFDNPNLRGTVENGTFRGVAEVFRDRHTEVDFELRKVERQSPTPTPAPSVGPNRASSVPRS